MLRNSTFTALLLAACVSPPADAPTPPTPPRFDERTACAAAPETSPVCIDDVSGIDEAAARAALGDREFAVIRDGDRLTIFARTPGQEANLCCSLQGPMTRIGETDLFVARYRLARLDEAHFSLIPPAWFDGRTITDQDIIRWSGANAPPLPARVETLRGERFERTLWSEHLRETRRLYIYLPPGHDRNRTYPALFAADGAGVMTLATMVERLILDNAIRPIVLIGAASGPEAIVEDRSSLGISDLRAADYLPGYEGGGDRFEQHLRFFAEELPAYATREFGVTTDRTQRAVSGFSNGGSFSLYAALRRPEVFGIALPLSPSWRRLTDSDFSEDNRARFLISGGLYEIGRQRAASGYAEALRTHGYDAAMETPVMGHDRDQEAVMLARYLPIAFPPTER
ncbi:MAG: alpha/beta hydrolase [Hyphomonadaceae bacterium]